MPAASGEPLLPGASFSGSAFSSLRGIRWRIDLGILPSSPASIDDLRRAAADSRRRYASLRRHILVDSQIFVDLSRSPNLAMDNPLSLSPDSTWGRFFRNAELERIVDQDLSRLYPGNETYFQTPSCQSMLRKILILWCLGHPDCGYRQGMHELLAPLLYVLHVDLQHLSQVQGLYKDRLQDDFDGMSFQQGDLISNNRFRMAAKPNTESDKENSSQGSVLRFCSLGELDPDTRDILLLSDAYGAEGELGILLSEKFMEHDAYCMFDSLMNGAHGVVALADFFSPSSATGSCSGLPPVIEASLALYYLLSIVDSSLHTHLVELAVEPQYFALRWLRVLFGREFSLEDLLVIWDEIFSFPNSRSFLDVENGGEVNFRVLCSPRGAFISSMAVSMLLHIRSSLLATENATSCLQRLVNFPEKLDVKKLIEKAKSLQALALDVNICSAASQVSNRHKPAVRRGHSLSFGSPESPLYSLPESYWEEKWRMMNTANELHRGSPNNTSMSARGKEILVEKLCLSRVESDPSPARAVTGDKDSTSLTWHRLLDDLSQESELAAYPDIICDVVPHTSGIKENPSAVQEAGNDFPEEQTGHIMGRDSDATEEALLKSENSSMLSTATSPLRMANEQENDSEKSSVTSASSTAFKHGDSTNVESCISHTKDNALPQESEATSATSMRLGQDTDRTKKQATVSKERKMLSGKFHWFRRFSRGSGEGNSEKVGKADAERLSYAGDDCKDILAEPTFSGCCDSLNVDERAEIGDKRVTAILQILGQSMLENIQVIESVFLHEWGDAGSLGNSEGSILESRGQVAAIAALKELRNISKLLSET